MNLLFITHARLRDPPYGDGSTRYRCFNVAEVARAAGHRVQVSNAASVNCEQLDQFDLISWLRPIHSEHMLRLLDCAHHRGISCIADLDDLIIDPALAGQSPAVINKFVKVRHLQKRFTAHASAVQLFDAITVSTETLHQQVQKIFPDKSIATVHNGLSQFWLQHVAATQAAPPSTPAMGYLPGTRSHDDDLAGISQPLCNWLSGHDQRQLRVVGKIDIKQEKWPAAQVRQEPWIDYYALPGIIGQFSATLAPLSATIFNLAKSHVKFIESAALGVPLIASPIHDITQHQTDGLILARDETQWLQALSIAADPDYRNECSDSLIDYANSRCTASRYAGELIKAWNNGHLLPEPVNPSAHKLAA